MKKWMQGFWRLVFLGKRTFVAENMDEFVHLILSHQVLQIIAKIGCNPPRRKLYPQETGTWNFFAVLEGTGRNGERVVLRLDDATFSNQTSWEQLYGGSLVATGEQWVMRVQETMEQLRRKTFRKVLPLTYTELARLALRKTPESAQASVK
jgi:hypothetical protein